MSRVVVRRLFIPFLCVSLSASLLAFAEVPFEPISESALVIDRMLATKDTIFIGFASQPKGCESNYNGFHAVLERTDSSFDQAFLQLRSAKNDQKSISIEYEATSECSKSAGKQSLLKMTAFTF